VTFVTLLPRRDSVRAGVLMIPLSASSGGRARPVSFAVSINLFLYGLSGPFIAGLMTDRIRPRHGDSLALVATGVALTT